MITWFMGDLGVPAALVLVALIIGCGASIGMLIQRKRPEDYAYDAKKLEFDHEVSEIVARGNLVIAEKKLQQNLITSHKED